MLILEWIYFPPIPLLELSIHPNLFLNKSEYYSLYLFKGL